MSAGTQDGPPSGSKLLVPKDAPAPRAGATPDAGGMWTTVLIAAACFSVIGWTDVLLLWHPLHLGTAEWEFATVTGTFEALPLGSIGLVGLAAVAIRRARGLLRRGLLALSLLVLVALVGALVLYGLALIQAWPTVDASIRPVFIKSVVKTSIFAVAYLVLYSSLVWRLGRNERRKER